MIIHEIPGKMVTSWDAGSKSIIDKVDTFRMSLDEFQGAVMEKGLEHAKSHGAIAWIVDSSTAEGNFKKEIQDYIDNVVFPTFAENGIEYFVTVKPEEPGLTSMTVENFASKVGPSGMQLVEAANVEVAKKWLRNQR